MQIANQIDHTNYPKTLRALDMTQLHFIIADCHETLDANPTGEKAGYYMDEIHYAAAEIQRRQELGPRGC